MVKRNGWWRLAVPLVALGLVAAACGRSDSTTTTTTTSGGGGTATTGAGGGTPAPAPGFDGTTIKLGVITPQTGAAAVIGNPLTAGNQVFFDALNASGGIAGKYKVELVIADSQYQPPVAVQQFNANKDNVAFFVQILGTAVTNAVLPQLTQANMGGSPASLDAFWQNEANLLPIGAPYQIQAINAVTWWATEGGGAGKKICVMAQDDPYGEAGTEGVNFAAEKLGTTVAATAKFRQGDQDFTAQIQQLSSAACDLVFLVSLPLETGAIINKAESLGFSPQWIGQSPSWVSRLAESPLAPLLEQKFLLVSEGPQWGDTSVPGMAKMLQDIQTYKPDQAPDIYFAFGYSQAWATAQLLEKAVANGDLSRDGIARAMSERQTLTFEGLLGEQIYGAPADREVPRISTIFKVNTQVPGALEAVKTNFETPAAKEYQFPS